MQKLVFVICIFAYAEIVDTVKCMAWHHKNTATQCAAADVLDASEAALQAAATSSSWQYDTVYLETGFMPDGDLDTAQLLQQAKAEAEVSTTGYQTPVCVYNQLHSRQGACSCKVY